MNIEKVNVRMILISLLIITVLINKTMDVMANGGRPMIGDHVVEGLSVDQMTMKLYDTINEWNREPFIIKGMGIEVSIDSTMIEYDVKGTIETYEEMSKKTHFSLWKSKPTVQIPMEIQNSEWIKEEIDQIQIWDTDETFRLVMEEISHFGLHEVEAEVTNSQMLEKEKIVTISENIPEEVANLNRLTDRLDGMVLNPNKIFSYLDLLEDELNEVNEETNNYLASMMYLLALQLNSEVIERHSQQKLPTYLQPGIEVRINRKFRENLQFTYTLPHPVQLSFTYENNQLVIEATSYEQMTEALIDVERDQVIKSKTITRLKTKHDDITSESVKGVDGLRVSVYRYQPKTTNKQLISKDYYPPKHTVDWKIMSSQLKTQQNTDDTQKNVIKENEEFDFNQDLSIDLSNYPKGSYVDKGGNIVTP